MDERFMMEKLSCLTGVDIVLWEEGRMLLMGENKGGNPLIENRNLVDMLCRKADMQQCPVVFRDEHQIVFSAARRDRAYCLAGPMNLSRKNLTEWHRYYRHYSISGEERPLPVMNITKILQFVEAVAHIFLGICCTDRELITENQLNALDPAKREHNRWEPGSEEYFHHSYQEERDLLECVRMGKSEEAVRRCASIDGSTGRLSGDDMAHWKYLMVVSITLCARAAIEGGVSPEEAYRISDHYIRKGDGSRDVNIVMSYRNMAIMDLAECVRNSRNRERLSSKVEWCRDYIDKNYSRKLSLQSMAKEAGISSAYLSRLFSREMGITIQQYIITVRLEKAEKLLRETDHTITEIAEYVHFTTQSRFTEQFRKWKGITPTEYRRQYARIDFR